MKRTLLVILLALACGGAAAQKAYQKFSTFKGDTVEYVKINFDDNKARYIGYKFEKFMTDYELPLVYEDENTAGFIGTSMFVDPQAKSYVNGFVLKYQRFFVIRDYRANNKKSAVIYVTFAPPYNENVDDANPKIERDLSKATVIKYAGQYVVQDIHVKY